MQKNNPRGLLYAASDNLEAVKLDTHRLIETPEGIDISLTVSGPISRILAYSIDLLIRGSIQAVIAIFLVFFGSMGFGIMSLIFFILEWFYPVYFEVFRNGQTPGKKRLNLQVIHDDGTPITWNSSILRNLLRFADFLPGAYFTGICSMILNNNFKRLGDLAAGTLVTYKVNKPTPPKIEKMTPISLPFPLSLDEQRAILSFTERRNEFSTERNAELANILSSMTDKKDADAVRHLHQIATALLIGAGKQDTP